MSDLNLLEEEEIITLSYIDDLRDCATHNLLELSEQSLYLQVRAGITLYDKLLFCCFGERLGDYLPIRVLPISTDPPQDMLVFLDSEFAQIKALMKPGTRRANNAKNRLKQFMIMESNIDGDGGQPTEKDLDNAMKKLKIGIAWQTMFPGVASLRIEATGEGPSVGIRLTREQGAAPVRVIRPGEPGGEDATIVREVDLWDRFSMSITIIAAHLDLTNPRALALVRFLKLQEDKSCFHEFMAGTQVFKRYSPEALDRLREALPSVDMSLVWEQHGPRKRTQSES